MSFKCANPTRGGDLLVYHRGADIPDTVCGRSNYCRGYMLCCSVASWLPASADGMVVIHFSG